MKDKTCEEIEHTEDVEECEYCKEIEEAITLKEFKWYKRG